MFKVREFAEYKSVNDLKYSVSSSHWSTSRMTNTIICLNYNDFICLNYVMLFSSYWIMCEYNLNLTLNNVVGIRYSGIQVTGTDKIISRGYTNW